MISAPNPLLPGHARNQLLNHRYNAELPTVITTSDAIEEVDARIRSRMLDTRLCTI